MGRRRREWCLRMPAGFTLAQVQIGDLPLCNQDDDTNQAGVAMGS